MIIIIIDNIHNIGMQCFEKSLLLLEKFKLSRNNLIDLEIGGLCRSGIS